MQSQYVVMLFPSPWIFFFSFSFENETDSAGYLVLFSESQHDETLLYDHRLQSTDQQPAEVEISILSQNFHSHFQQLSDDVDLSISSQHLYFQCQQLFEVKFQALTQTTFQFVFDNCTEYPQFN